MRLISLGIALLVAIAFVFLRRRAWARAARGGQTPADLQALLARVSESPGQDDARLVPRDLSSPPCHDGEDLGERLLQLSALHERGLISVSDYEAKKIQLLSRL